jgi:hypothetical protein
MRCREGRLQVRDDDEKPRQILLQSPTQKTTKIQKKSIRDHVAKDTLAASEMTVIIFGCTGQQVTTTTQ